MLSFYFGVTLLVRTFATLLYGSLLLLVLLQLRQDAKSRAFAALLGIIGANTGLSVMTRLAALFGLDIHWIFQIITLLTSALPLMLYLFVVAYFDAWTPARKRITYAYFALITVAAGVNASGLLIGQVQLTPDGLMRYELKPIAGPLLLLGFGAAYLALYVAWEQQRRASGPAQRRNRSIVIGVSIIVVGAMVMMVPALTAYTLEQVAYMLGALVIAGPVFRQRLFDPLAQLNTQLQHRADQLATIAAVSQHATSVLNVGALLAAVVQQIQQGFGYAFVSITLAQGELPNAQAVAGTFTSRLETMHFPLVVPTENGERTTVGTLAIQHGQQILNHDEHSVLDILTRQIAIAIQNAALFEQVQRANQSKTRFIHIIGHELRNPLQVLLGNLEGLFIPSLYPGVALTEAYWNDLRLVKKSSGDLRAMLDDILDMARIEAGMVEMQIREVQPLPILDDLRQTFAVQVRPGVDLVAAYVDSLPPVMADPLRLKQILTNLLSNACKFTQQGRILLNTSVHDTLLWFSVSDTGPGIPAAVQKRLFTNFAQASRQFGGAGLGLSISRQFARMQQGEVWFESREGQGTTFFCSVPLAQGVAAAQPLAGSERSQVTLLPKTYPLPELALVIGVEVERQAYLYDGGAALPYRVMSATDEEQGMSIALATLPSVIVCVEAPLLLDRLKAIPDLSASEIIPSAAAHWREALTNRSQNPDYSYR